MSNAALVRDYCNAESHLVELDDERFRRRLAAILFET